MVEQTQRQNNTQPYSVRKSAPVIVAQKTITNAAFTSFFGDAPPGCKYLIEDIKYTTISGATAVITFVDEYTTHLGTPTDDVIHISQALDIATYPSAMLDHAQPRGMVAEVDLRAKANAGQSAVVTVSARLIKGRIDIQD